jgi:hypothetical protein
LIPKSNATWHTGFWCFSASATASALNSFGYTRRSWSFFPIFFFSSPVVLFAYLCVYQRGIGPEQAYLHEIMDKGKHGTQKRKWAQALLLANEGYTDEAIAERVGMHYRGIEGLRQRFVEDGFETALEGKPRGKTRRGLSR